MTDGKNERLIDGLNAALGAMLFISPWVFGFASDRLAAWNAMASAALVIGVAVTALLKFAEWEEWVEFVLGLWIIISPWMIGYADTGVAHSVHMFIGLGVLVLSLWDLWLVHGRRPDETA